MRSIVFALLASLVAGAFAFAQYPLLDLTASAFVTQNSTIWPCSGSSGTVVRVARDSFAECPGVAQCVFSVDNSSISAYGTLDESGDMACPTPTAQGVLFPETAATATTFDLLCDGTSVIKGRTPFIYFGFVKPLRIDPPSIVFKSGLALAMVVSAVPDGSVDLASVFVAVRGQGRSPIIFAASYDVKAGRVTFFWPPFFTEIGSYGVGLSVDGQPGSIRWVPEFFNVTDPPEEEMSRVVSSTMSNGAVVVEALICTSSGVHIPASRLGSIVGLVVHSPAGATRTVTMTASDGAGERVIFTARDVVLGRDEQAYLGFYETGSRALPVSGEGTAVSEPDEQQTPFPVAAVVVPILVVLATIIILVARRCRKKDRQGPTESESRPSEVASDAAQSPPGSATGENYSSQVQATSQSSYGGRFYVMTSDVSASPPASRGDARDAFASTLSDDDRRNGESRGRTGYFTGSDMRASEKATRENSTGSWFSGSGNSGLRPRENSTRNHTGSYSEHSDTQLTRASGYSDGMDVTGGSESEFSPAGFGSYSETPTYVASYSDTHLASSYYQGQ